jgi:hypothetical protein
MNERADDATRTAAVMIEMVSDETTASGDQALASVGRGRRPG